MSKIYKSLQRDYSFYSLQQCGVSLPLQWITPKMKLLGIVILLVLSLNIGTAQISIQVGNTCNENFYYAHPSTADTLPLYWRIDSTAIVRTIDPYSKAGKRAPRLAGNSMSSSSPNGLYNFGAGNPGLATDRAFGGLSSSTGCQSVNLYVYLKNTGSTSITDFTISYDVEKYRKGSNAAGFRVQLYYSYNGVSWIDAGSNFLSSFPADPDNLGYVTAPGDSIIVNSQTLTLGTPLASDSLIYFAWNYSVTSGTTVTNAQALGVDDIVITANSNPLPVNLIAFESKKVSNTEVLISWDVAEEYDLLGYIVERSNNGRDFKSIGQVHAQQRNSYFFRDVNPFSGGNYYRLKIMDNNGASRYSDVQYVVLKKPETLTLYPNPTKGRIFISGVENNDLNVNVSIIDEKGQSVRSEIIHAGKLASTGMDMSSLNPGSYIVKIISDYSNSILRVIKE